MPNQDELMLCGPAVKSIGDDRIGGYLVAWGNPKDTDLTNEYFTPDTDFMLDRFPIAGQALVMYHHAQDAEVKGYELGTFDKVQADDYGLWAEAQLAIAEQYKEDPRVRAKLEKIILRVKALVQRGALGWSSGTAPQLVLNDGGHIRRWPIVEGSLTPSPAQPGKTRIQSIKSLSTGDTLESLLAKEGITDDSERADNTAHVTPSPIKSAKEIAMSMKNSAAIIEAVASQFPDATAEQIAAIVAAVEGGSDAAIVDEAPEDALAMEVYDDAKATPVQKAAARIAEAAAAKFRLASKQAAAKSFGGYAKHVANDPYATGVKAQSAATGNGENMAQKSAPWADNGAPVEIKHLAIKSKWSNLNPRAASMALAIGQQMYDRVRPGQRFLPGGVEEGLGVVQQIIADGALESAAKSYSPNARFEDRAAMCQLNYAEQQHMKSIKSMKANELGHTSNTNAGVDWVWTFWQTQIMEQARRENVIMSNLPQVDMPADVHEVPVSWTDPTMYLAAESTTTADLDHAGSNVTLSLLGTNKLTLNASKFGVRVAWSSEQDEDSIINYATQAQQQSTRAIENGLDYVIMNGDTTNSSSNINDDVGTIAAATSFLAFDGLRHMALVTTTANVINGGGDAITYADLVNLRGLLPREASSDQGDIFYVANPELLPYLLQIPEFLTLDKAGPQASVMSGQLGSVGNVPLLLSSQLYKSLATGFVSLTPSSNTFGQVVCVYRPYQRVGIRRAITPWLSRGDDGESFTLTLTARIAYKWRPDAGSVSVLRNVLS